MPLRTWPLACNFGAFGAFGAFGVAATLSGTLSCSGTQRPQLTIPDENEGPLSNVVLLPLTTRSTDDLLGHLWDTETDLADPLRPVLNGTVVVTGTQQHVMLFRDVTARGDRDGTVGMANAGVWAAHATHVLYDVQITALATFAAGTQSYVAGSGCCLQGNPTESCESGYVYRVMRGSGSIRLLRRLEGDASAEGRETVIARGGTRYRVADESSFNDAYFGLQLLPLESVCRSLTPEQELAPLRQLAPPNCTVQRYGALGEKEVLSRQLPSEELCKSVALHYCAEVTGAISCRVRFGTSDETDLLFANAATPVVETGGQKTGTSSKPSKKFQPQAAPAITSPSSKRSESPQPATPAP